MKLKSLINKKYLVENSEDAAQIIDVPKRSKALKQKEALERMMKILKQKDVKGSLNLSNLKIESLGNIERVSGNLRLDDCQLLTSLSNLKYIGNIANLPFCVIVTHLFQTICR